MHFADAMNHALNIPLGEIEVGARMRRPREDNIVELTASIREIGLLHPITVEQLGPHKYRLVAGASRLEAVKRLAHYAVISSVVMQGDGIDRAMLTEIDENLVRADLSPVETAAHHAKRKEIYERLHPETKDGATGKGRPKVRQNGEANDRYSKDAATKTGKSERAVQRDVARGKIPDVLDLVGTSLDKGDELDAFAKLSTEAQAELKARAVAGEKVSAKQEAKRQHRATRERELGQKVIALPRRRYGVVYADPPWSFKPYSDNTGMDRSADNHYPTMELQQICDLTIPAADDCALFLWATVPMLPKAISVMEAWGFDYKSHFCWVKDKPGTGYWNRNKHELLLIGTQGKIPAPAPGDQYESIILAPRGAHSAKPFAFREIIEEMFPSLPKLEMFARGEAVDGWDRWGNEAWKAA